ncbi:MAG: carbamoyltransferase [Bryobacterales bacterium]|nr:carbamoyltransferase [Bryobacterales bacterium]
MRVLGISAFYHDSAAALVDDGMIIAAAQEERFSRRKHDASFPAAAIRFCLERAGARLSELDAVAFYEKPFLKFERLLETYLSFAPRGFRSFRMAMPVWLREKLFQKDLLTKELRAIDGSFDPSRLRFTEHHLSHAASAFFPSPFGEAAILTMDGVGEWATTSAGIGRGASVEIHKEIHFPHSLGLLYSAFTYYCGFKVNSGEYKVMGLAPYGRPIYKAKIFESLVDVRPDGSFCLNLEYFNYTTGLTMTNARFDDLLGGPPRSPQCELNQHYKDCAASIQAVVEEIVLKIARPLRQETGMAHLCLAGGVALNSVANGRLLRERIFDDIWIQPAAGDAGGALGAALAVCSARHTPYRDAMQGALLGPDYTQAEIERYLYGEGARFQVLTDDHLLEACVESLTRGDALGWFQGRMEFGPRALGARSILADPRSPAMQARLNEKVKHRETFRPFAPAVPREFLPEWFELDRDSPYMLLVCPVAERRRGLMPAVTHVDGSARVQTVNHYDHPRFHDLLMRFGEHTGCPVLVNTSFNVRGEPLVTTPQDAFRCFLGTGLDSLAIGSCFLRKQEQNAELRELFAGYESGFDLD